jgi:hypothetical protein
VIVPYSEATGDAVGEPAEVSPHTLTDRFQGLETGGSRVRVDADAFGGTMIDRDEYRGRTFAGERSYDCLVLDFLWPPGGGPPMVHHDTLMASPYDLLTLVAR